MKNYNLAIREAKDMAKKILSDYNLKTPIDINKVARILGVKIKEYTVEDEDFGRSNISGFIKMENKEGKPIIIVNPGQSEERKSFTIAHELGHFLLHRNSGLHIDTSTSGIFFRDEKSSQAVDINEIQANQFAAELLMPTDEVREKLVFKVVEEGKDLDDATKELCEHYKVSATAMAIKVGSLIS